MQLVNYAAWIPAEKASLEVATAPFPDLAPDEVIVKNQAVAINPVDWKIQGSAVINVTYPAILGEDIAGEVFEVGKKVRGFKKGDRVISFALGLGAGAAYGGFQLYPRIQPEVLAKIPRDLSFQRAAVLPLSVTTAAAGLYLKRLLGLRFPTTAGKKDHVERSKPEVLIVWGGSSSVGSSAIQLAAASGYHVITTASPANYKYAKDLGAHLVLDYHNPDIVAILIALLQNNSSKVVGAYDAIGTDTTVRQNASVLEALGGGIVASVGAAPDNLHKSIKVARILASNILEEDSGAVAKAVWGEYLPAALEEGSFKAAPEELVVGNGLYYVQGAMDKQKAGVSAKKIVVTL